MKSSKLVTIALVIIALGAGFFGGMKYQQSKTPARTSQTFGTRAGGNGAGGASGASGAAGSFQRGQGQAFRPVMGQIISQDSSSITVKLQDGSSKIVLLPSTVVVSETTAGSVSGLKVGETVRVLGSANSDGSVSATDVQISPASPAANSTSGQTPAQGQ